MIERPEASEIPADEALTPRQKHIPVLIEAGRDTRFPPGVSGNPAGRASNAGTSIREWFNTMKSFTRKQVEAITNNPGESVERVAAAQKWLVACADGKSDVLREICDRTAGRPAQTLEMNIGESWNSELNFRLDPEALEMQRRLSAKAMELQAAEALKIKSLPP